MGVTLVKLPGAAFLSDRKAAKAFEEQDDAWRDLVFYSEGSADWPHLEPIIRLLIDEHDRRVSYLTSEVTDPGLSVDHPNLRTFNIGAGTARTVLFARIACRRFVMTLPDLGNLWLKRSVHPVEYVYLFHATNSSHTSYRRGAFNNYDTVLCVGPHHMEEIRAAERVYGLPEKRLVEHGSTKLDSLLAMFGDQPPPKQRAGVPRVLVAPTWGESSIIEQDIGHVAIEALLDSGAEVMLRPHPMTSRRLPQMLEAIARTHAGNPRFRLEQDMSNNESWLWSDLMLSDWSGAASEYAFSLHRPVVYLDTPPKRMNADWADVGLRSFEDLVRSEVGTVVGLDDLDQLPATVRRVSDEQSPRIDFDSVVRRLVFNPRRSAIAAAGFLADEEGTS
jgi:YidC/Oxa1 family membrane protein insertase